MVKETRILLIGGFSNPNRDYIAAGSDAAQLSPSFNNALFQAYHKGASEAGHSVGTILCHSMQFDPILRTSHAVKQPLEPDLVKAQSLIQNATHLVWIYPTWWGGMPALLKGFIDRTFQQGFAYQMKGNGPLWDKLLKGKTAHIITTMTAPGWYYQWVNQDCGITMLRKTILDFSGIGPQKITRIGGMNRLNQAQREGWLSKVEEFGRMGL